MGFLENFEPNPLAAPVGQGTREVTLTFTGITELSEKELHDLDTGKLHIITFNFLYNGKKNCSITKNHRKKLKKGKTAKEDVWEKYNFANNFVSDMFQAAGIDLCEGSALDLIGKTFTIIISKNDRGMAEYNIKGNDNVEESSENTEDNPF